jgi:hypothetical protein
MMAPPLASSPRVLGHSDYVIKALLNGLTGPLNNTTYPEVMIPVGQNTDEWIASIGSYVRNAFGNRASLISPADVARARRASASKKGLWTSAELEASLPKLLVRDPAWKLTASNNAATAMNALSIQPWSSGEAQKGGMWFQIELPQPVALAEIQFESGIVAPENVSAVPGAPTRTAIGGGRGRGAAPDGSVQPPAPGYPREYQVQTSTDGTNWGAPIVKGQGTGSSTRIALPSGIRTKYVRITETATVPNAPPWSIQRLQLYEAGSAQGTR